MTKKFVTSLALAAGCAMVLAVPPVQAQTMDTQVLSNGPRFDAGDRAGWRAARNNAESAQYDRLLEASPGFRHARARRECGPITDQQLRYNCFASFAEYEPYMGARTRTMANRTRSYPSTAHRYYPQERMTGSSNGMMNSTTTYGYSSNPAWGNNYAAPTNAYGASRNLPGEYSTGMNQAPGAMPNYPGPRVSGPMSGGGGAGGSGGGR